MHVAPDAHLFPHVPQFDVSLDTFAHVVPQLISFGGQTQIMFVHVDPVGQALPHAPQFALLVARSTH